METAQEIVYLNGDDYFASLLEDIAQARTQLDLEMYIFKNDVLGKRILHALLAAARRGVRVRILLDGANISSLGAFSKRVSQTNSVEIRVFHPFFWRIWQWPNTVVKQHFLHKIIYFMRNINSRNHRKVCLIDKKILYVGSANVDERHLSIVQGGKNWRDTIVKLGNVDTRDLENAFDRAWDHLTMQERLQQMFEPVDTNAVIRLNHTRHRRRVLYKNLLRTLSKCKKRVWITNAYFVPDNFILKKLTDLASAGVDVRIVLPQKSDVPMMTWASAAFYQQLLKSGVRIFEYLPSMLHAKTLIFDDWFLVGSSNMNHRSLLHDLEVDVNIRALSSKQRLEQQFLQDVSESKEITWAHWQKRSWLQRGVGRLLLYMKYWI